MTEKNPQEQNQTDAQFMIQRIYVKDSSFEAPGTPAAFQQEWHPELTLDLNTNHTKLDDEVYEVVLMVTATVKNKNEVAFLAEVRQAGIFTIQGAQTPQLEHLLGSFCPSILFPYAREIITSQVISGSFPQLVLAPINFDAVFLQQQEEKKKKADELSEKIH